MPDSRAVRPARTVLIVHRYFWPENISETPLLLRTIANHHLARGDSVRVVAGTSRDFCDEWQEAFGGEVTVRTFRTPVDRGLATIRRIINAMRLMRLAFFEIVGNRTDLLYVLSYPPLVGGVLIAFGRMVGRVQQSIYYVQDLFTYRIRNRILRRLYLAFNSFTIGLADRTVTLSEEMKGQLLSAMKPGRQKRLRARIQVIPNTSSDLASDLPRVSEKKIYDIIYAGAHGRAQNLDLFVAAMGLLSPDERPRAVFYGSGEARAGLMAHAEALGLGSSLEFREPVSRQEIAAEIARARFGLVGALPELMRYAFPSKLANYGALGVPSLVMCAHDSETADWLKSTGIGESLDPASPERAANQLRRLFNAARREPNARAIREATRRRFGVDNYLAALDRLLASLERPK